MKFYFLDFQLNHSQFFQWVDLLIPLLHIKAIFKDFPNVYSAKEENNKCRFKMTQERYIQSRKVEEYFPHSLIGKRIAYQLE
jgi:hypothetical protein